MLLGSRRRFRVNMGFGDGNRILIINFTFFKIMEGIKLIKEFLNKGWGLRETSTEARRSSSANG